MDRIKFVFSLMILLVALAVLVGLWSAPGIGIVVRALVTAMLVVIIVRIVLWWIGYIRGRGDGSDQ